MNTGFNGFQQRAFLTDWSHVMRDYYKVNGQFWTGKTGKAVYAKGMEQ